MKTMRVDGGQVGSVGFLLWVALAIGCGPEPGGNGEPGVDADAGPPVSSGLSCRVSGQDPSASGIELCAAGETCCTCGCGLPTEGCTYDLRCPPRTGPSCGSVQCRTGFVCCDEAGSVCARTADACLDL